MAATKAFIQKRVGAGGTNLKHDVQALQELLIANGHLAEGTADGAWTSKVGEALKEFLQKNQSAVIPVRDYVDPGDECLVAMASQAKLLIQLPRKTGIQGVYALHDWFRANGIRYNAGADKGGGNRAIYGLPGRPEYAAQRTDRQWKKGPVQMDCTTYVNLMLSVYRCGSAHAKPYDAGCADFGALSAVHCARDRYQLPRVQRASSGPIVGGENYFEDAKQIVAALSLASWKPLYVLEVGGGAKGGVTHMALLVGSPEFWVYECTTGQKGTGCIDRSLEQFLSNKKGKPIYLFGPSP